MTHDTFLKNATDEIASALRQGLCPWRQEWHGGENTGLPGNVGTRRLCKGVNWLLLQLAAQRHGFRSQWWNTRNQWTLLDGRVMPGAVEVKVWSPRGEIAVVNADQVEDVPWLQAGRPRPAAEEDFDRAEAVVEATRAKIRYRCGLEATYTYPPGDFITFPLKQQFLDGPGKVTGFYDLLFHECLHWTEPRLGWHGSRAVCELRAEMSSLLCGLTGIPCVTDLWLLPNHRRYVPEWCELLEADHTLLQRVAESAWQGAEYILSFSKVKAAA